MRVIANPLATGPWSVNYRYSQPD